MVHWPIQLISGQNVRLQARLINCPARYIVQSWISLAGLDLEVGTIRLSRICG